MRIEAKVKSNTAKLIQAQKDASREALIAMRQVYINRVKRGLRGGFTSGDFTKGILWNTVTGEEPVWGPNGWETRVGTNLRYAIYWELGHHNIFTRQFEWVPIWGPELEKGRQEMFDTYKRVLVNRLYYSLGS